MTRAYTVKELDALREAMNNKYLYGVYVLKSGRDYDSHPYYEADKIKAVEEMVRTAMIAGHTAEDYTQS